MRVIPAPETITPDTPLRLDVAARLAFPGGGMTESGLRNEIAKGNLRAELSLRQIAQRLRGSGRKPNKSSPSTSEKSINRNSATVIPIKSE
jgi:hypothetical protein